MRVGIWELLLLPIVAFYFTPTVVAWVRQKRNKAAITVLNIVAGWTLVGWIVALIWAVAQESDRGSVAGGTSTEGGT